MTSAGGWDSRSLVVATNNPGKLREFRRLLAPHGVAVVALAEAGWHADLDEPWVTYAENAVAKALPVATALGLPVLADDSGIEVDALRGWPGPLSARWLGPDASDDDRLRGLLAAVEERSPDDRRARYVCVTAICGPGAEPVTARGECLGLLVEPRGGAGFGYDPAFFSEELGKTFGEATDAEKDSVSHRARSLRQLASAGVLRPPQ